MGVFLSKNVKYIFCKKYVEQFESNNKIWCKNKKVFLIHILTFMDTNGAVYWVKDNLQQLYEEEKNDYLPKFHW